MALALACVFHLNFGLAREPTRTGRGMATGARRKGEGGYGILQCGAAVSDHVEEVKLASRLLCDDRDVSNIDEGGYLLYCMYIVTAYRTMYYRTLCIQTDVLG